MYHVLMAGLLLIMTAIAQASLITTTAADTFDTLFRQLDSNAFAERESAQQRLTELATGAQLTGAQIQTLQQSISSPNLEVSRRATEIFAAFVRSLPSYRMLLDTAQVQLTRPVLTDPASGDTTQDGQFRFDAANGSFRGPRFTSYDTFATLEQAWLPVQQALLVGNIGKARQELRNFRAAVENLTDFGIIVLDLKDNAGQALGKADMLDKIDAAVRGLRAFQLDLHNGGARDDSALPVPTPIRTAGLVPLGASLQLTVEQVIVPGSLLLFGPDPDSARALAPPGFEFVGHLFDMQALDGLLAGGLLGIDIQFGDLQLIGNPVRDPHALQIVRITGGQAFFLPTALTGFDRVAAHYMAATAAGSDQFGQFAIVQRIPEPAPLHLLPAGAALLWRKVRRQPQPAFSVAPGDGRTTCAPAA